MIYTVDYFIEKFSKIPEELWCMHALIINENGFEKRCAIGHCHPADWSEGVIANTQCEESLAFCRVLFNRMNINNGDDPKYQQSTPRQRILAALRDIKALQEKETPKPEIVTEFKERIVYVIVDEKVRELSKAELIEQ